MQQQFKVGDWVRDSRQGMKNPIVKLMPNCLAVTNPQMYAKQYTLWHPKVGELFWGGRTLHPDYQYATRTELFQVKHIHDDGTLSLMSPLDRNVYSLWIQPEDLQEFMKTAEPFIGELPTFLKETK